MATFSERIKELRLSHGLSQAELGEKLGISKGAVNNYEHASREPKLEMLEAIADFFNVDISYLLGKTNKTIEFTNALTSIIGKNGERDIRYDNSLDSNKKKLLEEMGIKKNNINYIVNKNNEKTELSDNEYDFLINSLSFYRKK